jgi:hypothetical protein
VIARWFDQLLRLGGHEFNPRDRRRWCRMSVSIAEAPIGTI